MIQLCYLAVLAACGGHVAAPAPIPAVDAIADDALHHDIAGLSIVILRGDEVVHARGYGFADLEHRTPATEHTVYPLASLSKQVWATAALQLVDTGRLDLDAPVKTILYTFPDDRVRIRDLLQQTSGLGDDDDNEDDVRFSDVSLAFAPGSHWFYSNRGAILVRRVVEQVTGQSFHDYLAAHVPSLTTCGDHVPLYDHGKPSGLSDARMKRVQFVCADALAVAHFEVALDHLLKPATLARMRTPVRLGDIPIGYGLLTRIGNLQGHVAYGHTGAFDGVNVSAYRFPDDALTIVVMMNSTAPPGFEAHDLVVRIAMDQLHLAPEPPRAPPPELLAEVAGHYEADGHPGETIVRDGRAILLIEGHETPLDYLGGRRFRAPGFDLEYVPATGRSTACIIGTPLKLETFARRTD